MKDQRKALLLVGSAKRPQSTSESLGRYLLARLATRGYETETAILYQSFRADRRCESLLEAAHHADLLVLAFPLYVDSLPSLVIRTLELMAEHRRIKSSRRTQRLAAIVNCGFPEAHQCDTALAICRRFAQETGLEWAGGLALGGGEAINGQPVLKVKGLARNVIKALDLAGEALAAGEPVPQRAIRLMAKPLMPAWTYTWVAGWRWKRRARQHGMRAKLNARPYQTFRSEGEEESGVQLRRSE